MIVKQLLENIRAELSTWRNTGLNEAQTSQVIVLRLLQALGYDIWNPAEVFAQEAANGNIPDFIISWERERRFIIEVKRLDTPLSDKMKTQAVSYANNHAIQWAILTNGTEWLLFDSFLVKKPAHERLILALSLEAQNSQILAQYVERLLDSSVWSKPRDYLQTTAEDIQAYIALNSQVQPLALELQQLMNEYTVQDLDAGLKLAEKLALWPPAKQALVQEQRDLLKKLLEVPSDTGVSVASQPAEQSSILEVLKQGIAQTRRIAGKTRGSELKAFIQDDAIDVVNWHDLHAGIAEAFLILGRGEELEHNDSLYARTDERLKRHGASYPVSSYRKLSNDRFLFLSMNAESHCRKLKHLLSLLNAAENTFTILYQGRTYHLP